MTGLFDENGAENIRRSPFMEEQLGQSHTYSSTRRVRTLIYTTNAIENFNRQLRKVTKSKSVFPTDDSLLKMLYLAMIDITKKWTGRRKDWGQIHSQLEIFFADRLPD
jgi:transposase-like protein